MSPLTPVWLAARDTDDVLRRKGRWIRPPWLLSEALGLRRMQWELDDLSTTWYLGTRYCLSIDFLFFFFSLHSCYFFSHEKESVNALFSWSWLLLLRKRHA